MSRLFDLVLGRPQDATKLAATKLPTAQDAGLHAGLHSGLLADRDFTAALMTAAQAAHRDRQFAMVEPLAFAEISAGKSKRVFNLTPLFRDYLQRPDTLNALQARYLAFVSETVALDKTHFTPAMIVPLVRQSNDFASADVDLTVCEPLIDDLMIVYAFDLPHSLSYMTGAQARALGLQPHALRSVAMTNLGRFIPKTTTTFTSGVAVITADGVNASSFLMSAAFWQQGPFATIASIIAIAPDRDLLLATDASDPTAIRAMETIARQASAVATAPLSLKALTVKPSLLRS
jgi:uncharacterized protein YtpQ (UPF0354 family)